jgi:predicted nucleic acid-binding protein
MMEVVSMPADAYVDEKGIRDADDRPILRAAINAGVDILLTGDKDFTESTVTQPKIMTVAQFIQL